MVSARQTPPTPAPAAAPAQKASDESEIRLHNDFGWIGRYRDANAKVTEPVTIIFMGDSITRGWFDKMPGFFTSGRVGRGIGGQTTTRMLLHFCQAADAPAVGAAILPFLERLVPSDATLIQAGR